MEEVKARLRAAVQMVDSATLHDHLHPLFAGPAAVQRAIQENALLCVEGPRDNLMYPMFQFDPDGNLNATVKEVNQLLGAGSDPWGVLDWWASPSTWLPEHPMPMSLVRTEAEGVLPEVARALLG